MTEDSQPKEKAGLASRKLALEALIKIDSEGAYANLALKAAFQRKSLPERDRAFVTALVQGVTRNRKTIDEEIGKLSKKPLEKMPVSLRNILRLAFFQLQFMEDIPDSAVINTACNLAKKTGHVGQVAFANGILRNFARKEKCEPKKSNVPEWLISKWQAKWGDEETEKLVQFTSEIPELTIRVCEMSITVEGLLEIFRGKGIKCRQGELVRTCIIIEDRGNLKGPISKLPGYKEGLFTVQDEAASFVSLVVDPKPGEVIIDLCAAPGGKSVHLSELMENKGRVISVDSHEGRLKLLKETRNRLALTNIEIKTFDGREFKLDESVDKILIDAPCAGTGVMNRRSDLALHRQAPDMVALTTLQKELLENAAQLLKPGGTLVYSTCSIEPEENEELIKWFLETHKDFQAEDLSPFIAPGLVSQWQETDKNFDPKSGLLQLLPSRHGLSGFFIARLRKLENKN
jgi:16S rRNA (cytosine967-C5)-methyltransferase